MVQFVLTSFFLSFNTLRIKTHLCATVSSSCCPSKLPRCYFTDWWFILNFQRVDFQTCRITWVGVAWTLICRVAIAWLSSWWGPGPVAEACSGLCATATRFAASWPGIKPAPVAVCKEVELRMLGTICTKLIHWLEFKVPEGYFLPLINAVRVVHSIKSREQRWDERLAGGGGGSSLYLYCMLAHPPARAIFIKSKWLSKINVFNL